MRFVTIAVRAAILFVGVAVPAFIIGMVLSSQARGAEAAKTSNHFITAFQLKALCDTGDQRCGGYVFGVLDTLTTALECEGTASQPTSDEVATVLRSVLERATPELLNTTSGAAMVSFAFSHTTVGKRCSADSNGI